MANQTLFSAPKFNVPAADTTNNAGGKAYSLTSEHALAVYACTGTFHSTFYTSAQEQLSEVKRLAYEVSTVRLAKTAVMARTKGFMKDVPAFLTAVLYIRDLGLWKKVFPRVVDNGRMLRTYAQIARSGAAGKVINLSSSAHRRAIQEWFDNRSCDTLFRNSVGNSPSLVGVLRMARVKPKTREKEALLKYLFNNEFGWSHVQAAREGSSLHSTNDDLPDLVKQYELFKANKNGDVGVPEVDFRQLDSLGLNPEQWAQVFRNANWTFIRMNLNTAVRQGVLGVPGMIDLIAARLRDAGEIKKARAFPYQLYMSFMATRGNIPHAIDDALQDAVEFSLENVPSLGNVVVAIDVSGSMNNAVTGDRGSATSKVRNVDIAALFASAVLRKNKSARVIPFASTIKPVTLNGRDSVVTNASTLAKLIGGGTNCSAPLAQLNLEGYKSDLFVLISDNESWVDSTNMWNKGNGTRLHEEWLRFKKHNPNAKMVCIDISPTGTSQVKERPDILQVAGFSDQVFEVIASFTLGSNAANFWVAEIDKIEV
jgi:60 kDa SS-A/Ro ribonucleoprotein